MKIPKSQLQFPIHRRRRSKPPSFSATERNDNWPTFLFENWGKSEESPRTAAFLLNSPPPENLRGSARFFVAAGSSSALIVDDPSSSSSSASSSSTDESPPGNLEADPEDFIALLTYSPSPYDDFRRSMEEMVDARVGDGGRVDWEFLEELLFCYLDLNNRKSYRHILRAFVDLIVVLRENPRRRMI
ncbi:ovate family protein [Striga asiatica]|uniref:Transcription repressor n=1 Tax=Striga asiatica TaxID=4170 RepID=A0A5A7QFS7_STRAF|nr:ovate family protein [Striga asiatica]